MASAEVVEAVSPPLDFTTEWLLEHPLSSLAQTEKVVERLVQQLALRLSAQDAGALEVACRFTFESALPVTLAAGLFRPTQSANHLLEILGMHLERLLLPGPVTSVTVHVARHAPLERRQQVLFEAARSLADSSQLAGLVDRLAGRLGSGAVVECRLQSDAQPELAYREEPLVGGVKRKRRSTAKPPALTPTSIAHCDYWLAPRRSKHGRFFPTAHRSASKPPAASTTSPGTGAPSGSKPAGGENVACGATTTASRPTKAAASGCSEV